MNTKTVLACTAVIVAFALIVAPLAIIRRCISKKETCNDGNRASQSIKQHQSSHQSSQSIGGGGNFLSGNNVNFQNQHNTGQQQFRSKHSD